MVLILLTGMLLTFDTTLSETPHVQNTDISVTSVVLDLELATVTSDTTSRPKICVPQGSEDFPHGSTKVSQNGSVLMYSCESGYELKGVERRECLVDLTWSGETPTCLPVAVSPISFDSTAWSQIYESNRMWEGNYTYKGNLFKFTLEVVQHSSQNSSNQIVAVFKDDSAEFELKASTRFPDGISWSVTDRGVDETDEKEEKGEDWVYRGKVTSSVPGFNRFNMRPARHSKSVSESTVSILSARLPQQQEVIDVVDEEEDEDIGSYDLPSSLALTLGISIAVLAVVTAAVLAAVCRRRRAAAFSDSSSAARQTLTSFENPIYDYETNVK